MLRFVFFCVLFPLVGFSIVLCVFLFFVFFFLLGSWAGYGYIAPIRIVVADSV